MDKFDCLNHYYYYHYFHRLCHGWLPYEGSPNGGGLLIFPSASTPQQDSLLTSKSSHISISALFKAFSILLPMVSDDPLTTFVISGHLPSGVITRAPV